MRHDVFFAEPYYRRYKLADPEGRLELLLDRCKLSERLTDLVRPYLAERAATWVVELAEATWLPTDAFPLIRRLVAIQALDLDTTVQKLKPVVLSAEPPPHRWNLIVAMSTHGHNIVEESELDAERTTLAAYIELVLEDPLGYIEEITELEDLGVAADVLGVNYSTDSFNDAWGTVEE